MAQPTSSDLIALAPEFANTDPAMINLYLGYAGNYVNAGFWGTGYNYALLLYTAHLLSMQVRASGGSGAVGPVTSERVGDLSRNYASPTTSSLADQLLMLTPWGIQFLQLRQTKLLTPMVTGGLPDIAVRNGFGFNGGGGLL